MNQSAAQSHLSVPADVTSAAGRGCGWYRLVKPILDRAIAVVALVVLLPFLLLIAAAIRIDSPGPVIYRQRRIGLNGKEFTMFKFRTMFVNSDDSLHRAAFERFFLARSLADASGSTFKIQNDPRVTRLGRFLRSSSLDELPQLVNVALGSMSLVGPRPPIAYETRLYEPRHWQRLTVRPGITGLWQATARSQVAFEDMVALDLKYVAGVSLLLDVKILALTVITVLSRKGAG